MTGFIMIFFFVAVFLLLIIQLTYKQSIIDSIHQIFHLDSWVVSLSFFDHEHRSRGPISNKLVHTCSKNVMLRVTLELRGVGTRSGKGGGHPKGSKGGGIKRHVTLV